MTTAPLPAAPPDAGPPDEGVTAKAKAPPLDASAVNPAQRANSDAEFAEIMRLLKKRFADNELVQSPGLGRETLPGILDKLGGAAVISDARLPATGQAEPIYTELLPHRVGYWRLESFRPRNSLEALRNQLRLWERSGVIGVVLDVRDFQDLNDYAGAAELAALFVPGERMLYSTQGLQIPQRIYGTEGEGIAARMPLVVLTNPRTAGAAEALAAALRGQVGAILLGRSTAGQGAIWQEAALESGRTLRLMVGEATLADGTALFGKPVVPDIPLYIDEASELASLRLIAQGQARKLVRERPARERLNEAALVRQENPELDEAILERQREQNGGAEPTGEEPPRDIALIRAMDVLRAIDATER
ncbi:MAG: S41 family peptidase [Verrucomicrobiota bacterium]